MIFCQSNFQFLFFSFWAIVTIFISRISYFFFSKIGKCLGAGWIIVIDCAVQLVQSATRLILHPSCIYPWAVVAAPSRRLQKYVCAAALALYIPGSARHLFPRAANFLRKYELAGGRHVRRLALNGVIGPSIDCCIRDVKLKGARSRPILKWQFVQKKMR